MLVKFVASRESNWDCCQLFTYYGMYYFSSNSLITFSERVLFFLYICTLSLSLRWREVLASSIQLMNQVYCFLSCRTTTPNEERENSLSLATCADGKIFLNCRRDVNFFLYSSITKRQFEHSRTKRLGNLGREVFTTPLPPLLEPSCQSYGVGGPGYSILTNLSLNQLVRKLKLYSRPFFLPRFNSHWTL